MSDIRMSLWVCTECRGRFMLDADLLDADEAEEFELGCPYCDSTAIGEYYAEGVVS